MSRSDTACGMIPGTEALMASRRAPSCRRLLLAASIVLAAGRVAPAQQPTSADELDARLAEALVAYVDNSVSLTHAQVMTEGLRYRTGVPSLLHDMQQALDASIGRLAAVRTDDERRARLVKAVLQIATSQRAASEDYIKAVAAAQQASAWGASALDLRKRSMTQSASANEQLASLKADLQALEAASAKFGSSLPKDLRYATGLIERPTRIRLGCLVLSRNPFYLLVAYTDGWAYQLGLRVTDTIRSAGGREFTASDSLEDFKLVIQQNLGKTLKVVVEREGKRLELPLKLPKTIPAQALSPR
jgi:hypothetical protein